MIMQQPKYRIIEDIRRDGSQIWVEVFCPRAGVFIAARWVCVKDGFLTVDDAKKYIDRHITVKRNIIDYP